MSAKPRWVYYAPAEHLLVAALLLLVIYIFEWAYAGVAWLFLVLADVPASLPYYILGWKFPALAVVWVLLAGTAWWYALSIVLWQFINRNRQ